MEKINKIIIIVILFSVFLICNHLVDISSNGISLGLDLTNGFFQTNSNQIYHIAWYISYLSVFLLVVFSIKNVRWYNENKI